MLRILSSCSATVRRSLHGLDYIAADCGKAFNELIAMLPKVSSDCTWVERGREHLWRQSSISSLITRRRDSTLLTTKP